MIETVRRCTFVETLPLEHVDHSQHAVHRRADLVAHGGEECRFCLVGGLGLGTRPFSRVARGFGGLLGGGERLFSLLQLGDVAADHEQPAALQRLEIEFDLTGRSPCAARSD